MDGVLRASSDPKGSERALALCPLLRLAPLGQLVL